jgi:hypothetical protein
MNDKIVRNRRSSLTCTSATQRAERPALADLDLQRHSDLMALFNAFRETFDESYVRHLLKKNHFFRSSKPTGLDGYGNGSFSWASPNSGISRPPKEDLTYISSGLTFSAWRISTSHVLPTTPRRPPMDLVVKFPHSIPRERLGPSFRSWNARIQRCPFPLALMPPLALMEWDDGFAVVMPFADSPLSAALPHWQPMDQRVEELKRGLAAVGMALNDPLLAVTQDQVHLQAGCWRGVPFIYDLSDLEPLP